MMFICLHSRLKPLLHPIIHAHTSWLRRKLPDLQGTLKAHLRFYNKISRLHMIYNMVEIKQTFSILMLRQ